MQDIEDFITYLKLWEALFHTQEERKKGFLTESTLYGLKVTLKATLEILDYLTKRRLYMYLMTSRLNQDNLEVKPFSSYAYLLKELQTWRVNWKQNF